MIQLKKSIYSISRICLMNGSTEVAMIPSNIDLAVITANVDTENTATFTPDMTYLDIKDLDAFITNLSKYRLPTLEND